MTAPIDDLGAADEAARAAWEDGEGAGVVTSAGIWHAALEYERRRIAAIEPVATMRAALESIARAPAFDQNTQSLVDLARSTLARLFLQ